MKLAAPPQTYSRDDQAHLRREIERADGENQKRGRDIEVVPGARLIFTDTADGLRYAMVLTAGAPVFTAV